MIDWGNVAANALWIVGCALALGTLSYASWEASVYKEKFWLRLKHRGYQISLNLAGVLFCAGLAATSGSLFQTIVWSILAGLFLVQVFFAWRDKRVLHQ